MLFDDEIEISTGCEGSGEGAPFGHAVVDGVSRATRGGLTIYSGPAAHETTLVGQEGRPGARYIFGEAVCKQIEVLQRRAVNAPHPELVVRHLISATSRCRGPVRCV